MTEESSLCLLGGFPSKIPEEWETVLRAFSISSAGADKEAHFESVFSAQVK
jgi:hypothetical protein